MPRYKNNAKSSSRDIVLEKKSMVVVLEDTEWLKRVSALYLKRSFEALGRMGEPGLAAAVYCLGREAVLKIAFQLERNGDDSEIHRMEWGSIDWQDPDDGAEEFFKTLGRKSSLFRKRFGKALHSELSAFADDADGVVARNSLEKHLVSVEETLGLSQGERGLLRFLLTLDNVVSMEEHFRTWLSIFAFSQRPLLSRILQTSREELGQIAGGRLENLEIIDVHPHDVFLEGNFYKFLDFSGGLDLKSSFLPAEPPKLSLGDFFLDDSTVEMLRGLLTASPRTPTHVLLYGPAGVGKTQFARAIALASGLPAYEVVPDCSVASHRRNLVVADGCLRRRGDAILIVDEADALLEGGYWTGRGHHDDGSKSFLDHFLERPGGRCLWVANDVSEIPESVARRFAFSLAFPRLGHRERRKVWRTVRDELQPVGGEILSERTLEILAREEDLSPAVISQAFRKSLDAGADSEERLADYMKRQFRAHERLSGTPRSLRRQAGGYRLEGVSSSPSPEELRKILAAWKDSFSGRGEGLGLLFEGPAGSGKKELVRHLALELDMELVEALGPELRSGGPRHREDALADLVERAEALGGILLFGGLESLELKGREAWDWERGNGLERLLARLESFKGVYVGLADGAPSVWSPLLLSSFTFKVEFGSPDAAGREALFDSLLFPRAGKSLTGDERRRLHSIPELYPGDFARVAARCRWRGTGADNLDLIGALENEASRRRGPEAGALLAG
jgi:SpoVK/Ycf46/Vps4 family AAA+-type ATPase